MRCQIICKILIILIITKITIAIEPTTITAGIVAIGLFAYKHTFCKYFGECCSDDYIAINKTGLQTDLRKHLFGQHIVIDKVVSAISAHYSNLSKVKKPLVMTFHGKSGCGKNYVADFIVKNTYGMGFKSQYVHKFLGREKFPQKNMVDSYRVFLRDYITNAIKLCSRSIFIFDEVDKMPAGLFSSVKPFLEYHNNIDGLNYREAVYIFLTNSGEEQITQLLLEKMSVEKRERKDVKYIDFEKYCGLGVYNEDGGLNRDSIIDANLIDHYIPFLPMEVKHVRQCVEAEIFRITGAAGSKKLIDAVMDEVSIEDNGLFVLGGCKRISNSVLYHIETFENLLDT